MQFIPLILVLVTALITIIIGLVNENEIILCLKNLSIVIILFYIIGNIVKKLLSLILNMENNVSEEEKTEDGRADDQIITSEKSGDDFEE